MGIATKQLEAIFKEIEERLRTNRYISIQPGEGNPPERYEVTYNITGLHQSKDKGVHEATRHSITIAIPFGFPHFPPNCKPLSPVFHPDFDQAAICIGDFWNKERTIPDLIFHIGHMIAGEVFSTDNAFNDEAVLWYRQHKAELPFAVIDFSDEPTPPAAHADSFAELEALEIDTLDESDFETDFDFSQAEISPAPVTTQQRTSEVDIDLLHLMVKQKRFHALSELLQAIPADKQFSTYDELQNNASLQLNKAKQLLQKGLDAMSQGQPGKALEEFQHLAATVTDYPEIESHIKRAQKAVQASVVDKPQTSASPPSGKGVTDSIPKETAKDKKLTFFNEKPEVRIPILPLFLAAASTILLCLLIFAFFSSRSDMKRAAETYSSCTSLLEANNFKDADQKCNEALAIVKGILFFNTTQRSQLTSTIQSTLNSETLRQGLAGLILINGKYVSKNTKEALLALSETIEDGDKALTSQSWNEAVSKYQLALNLSRKIGQTGKDNESSMHKVKENLALAQVHLSLDEGRQLKESGEYEKAVIALEKAQEYSKSLKADEAPPLRTSLDSLLSVSQFLRAKQAGDTAFTANDWQNAAEHYQKAMDIAKRSQSASEPEIIEVNKSKAKADLYFAIKSGKNAFDNGQWDEAIHQYESALTLLKENSEILMQVSSDENRQKISRIMLQASVIRDKQDIARKLKDGKNKQAIDKLQSIIESITKSPFSRDQEFQQVIREAHLSIAETKHNQLVAEYIAYLNENYKEMFIKNFPSARPEALSDPKATFVKKLDERLLFKIECTDTGEGRPLRLIMNYIYNPADKQWQLYSETR